MYNCVRCHNSHFTDEKMLCEDAAIWPVAEGGVLGTAQPPSAWGTQDPGEIHVTFLNLKGTRNTLAPPGGGAGWMRTCQRQGASAATAAVEHPQTVHVHTRARYSYGKPVSALLRCSASRSLALRCSPLTHEGGGPLFTSHLGGLRTVHRLFLSIPAAWPHLLATCPHNSCKAHCKSTLVHRGNEIQIELNRLFHETSLETENAVLSLCIFPG